MILRGDWLTGSEVVAQWYEEVKNYDFRRHAGSNTGLFMLTLLLLTL